MRRKFLKVFALIASVVMAFSMASCQELIDKLTDVADELAKKINATLTGISYIMENFENFASPLMGNGTVTDEWVNGGLDEAFVRPDSMLNLAKGYYEENGEKKSYSNLGTLSCMQDMVDYVQTLKDAGFDSYHEAFSWDFYNVMVAANTNKLCMALKKGDVYVQVAFFVQNSTSDESSEEDLTSAEGIAMLNEEENPTVGTEGKNEENSTVVDKTVNAVFTIANYDLLENKVAASSEESSEESAKQSENGNSEDNKEPATDVIE